jgi:CBS domain-containing protein
MNIADILRHKGAAVATITPSGAVGEMLQALAEHNVGALVVSDAGVVVGIVSERDIVRRLHTRGAQLLADPVSEIMTAPVVSCGSQDSVDTVAETMTNRRIRHMPVIDAGNLVGIVSIGDVVSSQIRQLEQDRGQLEHYITG